MPQYTYRGRDREGNMRAGHRNALNLDVLNSELIKEGITPIQITEGKGTASYWKKILDALQGENVHLEELSIFSRQMQLLHEAGVPIVTALKQLASYTRSRRLATALNGSIEYLEQGQSLATAMQHYPEVFSPMIINIIQIGENTGHLSESFAHVHKYLAFEASSIKQVKSSFRYPIFVFVSIIVSIILLNIFVIPTFAKFYVNLTTSLPWQTNLLIGMSNFTVHYGLYLLIFLAGISYLIHRYLKTPRGKYRWNKLELRIPVMGKLLRRTILIRFTQALSIILGSGISITQGLVLVRQLINNSYIGGQISEMQESIERGFSFTQAITKVDLFSQLEIQILSVGEKNGELSPALSFIGNFHTHEIEYDLKRMNDLIGPILITIVSVLILIIALGVYLPIWNMINLVHT